MKRSIITALVAGGAVLLFQNVHATLLFEGGFNYSTGHIGGDVNPNGNAWSGSTSKLTVASGNLTYSGLEDSGGNELEIINGSSSITTYDTFANQTSGTIYYSFFYDNN